MRDNGNSGVPHRTTKGFHVHIETVVGVVAYCVITISVWLLPTLMGGTLKPYGKAWLGPATSIMDKVNRVVGISNTVAGQLVRSIGSLCIMGLLILPFWAALQIRSRTPLRITMMAIGIIVFAIYFGLAVIALRLDRFSLD